MQRKGHFITALNVGTTIFYIDSNYHMAFIRKIERNTSILKQVDILHAHMILLFLLLDIVVSSVLPTHTVSGKHSLDYLFDVQQG